MPQNLSGTLLTLAPSTYSPSSTCVQGTLGVYKVLGLPECITLELTDNMKLPDAYANNQVLHLPLACCPSIRRLNRSAPIDAACTPMLGGRRLHVIVG